LVGFDVHCEARVAQWNAAIAITAGARIWFADATVALVIFVIEEAGIDAESAHRGPSGARVRAFAVHRGPGIHQIRRAAQAASKVALPYEIEDKGFLWDLMCTSSPSLSGYH